MDKKALAKKFIYRFKGEYLELITTQLDEIRKRVGRYYSRDMAKNRIYWSMDSLVFPAFISKFNKISSLVEDLLRTAASEPTISVTAHHDQFSGPYAGGRASWIISQPDKLYLVVTLVETMRIECVYTWWQRMLNKLKSSICYPKYYKTIREYTVHCYYDVDSETESVPLHALSVEGDVKDTTLAEFVRKEKEKHDGRERYHRKIIFANRS